jgi:hypothetical protein
MLVGQGIGRDPSEDNSGSIFDKVVLRLFRFVEWSSGDIARVVIDLSEGSDTVFGSSNDSSIFTLW